MARYPRAPAVTLAPEAARPQDRRMRKPTLTATRLPAGSASWQVAAFVLTLAGIGFIVVRGATAVLCLGLFEGAFAAEIFRAGILSVPAGQEEAARSLGLRTWPTQRFIILPQALRIVLPPLASMAVSTIKHSAIISVIAVF